MLVSRQGVTEHSHWSVSKFEGAHYKSADQIRMSSFDAPLSTQPGWQSQYSFLPSAGESTYAGAYEHHHGATSNVNVNAQAQAQAQPRSTPAPSQAMELEGPEASGPRSQSSPVGHHHNLDPLGLRQTRQPSPIAEQPETQEERYAQEQPKQVTEDAMASDVTVAAADPLSASPSVVQDAGVSPTHVSSDGQALVKEEEDDMLDDDDMEDDGDGDATTQQPMTAAERTAARRKMKRFRLTHQQTRFLMSEFAKQPHPDAAHRERLSREIPGLSPRQVQVWFQNRRAKIKRLTADDRERMMKMRAVPDDFDNVQALHSPYGAVHGLNPMTSPVDFGASPYAPDPMMRPLMVDVRRSEGEDHLSPTGLSPAFGGIGFNPSTGLNTPDMLSPVSPAHSDRYGYPSHLSAPLSAGPRTSNPFARQNSMDTGMQMHRHHAGQQVRPLQPLQLRETMNRSRSDSLQSPLRSSMSWKGDAIDYTNYHGGSSPQMSGRHPSLYQSDSMSGPSTAGMSAYESSSYSAGSAVQSPSPINYPGFPNPNLQQSQESRSRLRATSATLPLNLDLRNQYRPPHAMSSAGPAPGGPRTASTSQFGGGVSSSFSSSFPSAPLTAPIDFPMQRTPSFHKAPHTPATDYAMPQMSAPIAPPNDFSQAFQASLNQQPSSRTPMRDSFAGAHPHSQPSPTEQHHSSHHHQRPDEFRADPLRRQQSFSPVAAAQGAGAGYGAAS